MIWWSALLRPSSRERRPGRLVTERFSFRTSRRRFASGRRKKEKRRFSALFLSDFVAFHAWFDCGLPWKPIGSASLWLIKEKKGTAASEAARSKAQAGRGSNLEYAPSADADHPLGLGHWALDIHIR